jgi:ABC-type phosphate transport system substrate-binding protein
MFIDKFACSLFLLTLMGAPLARELVVIVSAKNPGTALRAEQVADIFLAQTGRFPQGGAAVAIDQMLGSRSRDEFYYKVASKSPSLVKAYWTRMVFTGRGEPPREAAGNEAVRKLIAGNPEMIGYIDRDALDDSVKVLLVLH